jgi:beta-glucosidase/6-phospho-beta-glucosidase/beta-galactosidase
MESVLRSLHTPTNPAQTKVAQQYDLERTLYYQSFLREMLKSIYEDGVNVVGALAWSFQ